MSAVFDKTCPFCARPQFLWGGKTCDVCDRDNNGINDKDEPVGIACTVDEHLLFQPEERGWLIIGARRHTKPLPFGLSILNDVGKRPFIIRTLLTLRRRFELEARRPFGGRIELTWATMDMNRFTLDGHRQMWVQAIGIS